MGMSLLRMMLLTLNSQRSLTGTSFHLTTLMDTESHKPQTECGERPQLNMMEIPARELMQTGTGISTGVRLEPLGTAAPRPTMDQNLHSYSQLILMPWGYTYENAPGYDAMFDLGN